MPPPGPGALDDEDGVTHILPSSPAKPKKKVRMQPVIDEEPQKPLDTFDTFHVRISNVRGVLRVAEARPVLLSFEFDNYWYAETDVFSENVEPIWGINSSSIRGLDGRKPSAADHDPSLPRDDSLESRNGSDESAVLPVANFVYETEFGYKLHRRFLIVRLSERSPYGDVEWGSAVVPLDSIARGCEAIDLSIIAKDGVTCYGNVYCNIAMVNVQTVRAHLTDLKLSDYPSSYTYDVKLIYLEFGVQGFEHGYHNCTEKRSETEPRFRAQPTVERDATLRDMIASSASGATSLKIFFSVHRQVARNRTEEIGVGALPVRMLFSKVLEGWMDVPTKFKVPLANYKGVIRGKVLLRNIPQFSQLAGADLINVDGTIYPLEVDLKSRLLLPWVKLPRSRDARPTSGSAGNVNAGDGELPHELSSATVGATDMVQTRTQAMAQAFEGVEYQPPGNENVLSHGQGYDITSGYGNEQEQITANERNNVNGQGNRNDHWSGRRYHSSVTESASASASDGGSDSSGVRTASPRKARGRARSSAPAREADARPGYAYQSQQQAQQAPAARHVAYAGASEHGSAATSGTNRLLLNSQLARQDEDSTYGITLDMPPDVSTGSVRYDDVVERYGADGKEESWQELGSLSLSSSRQARLQQASQHSASSSSRHANWQEAQSAHSLRNGRCKSGKSVGSVGTADGGVEIGSVVFSTGSDEGYNTGSRTTTEDALTASQRLTGPPLDGPYEEEEEDEWVAIEDPSSSRFYFAHKFTQESLWLPPDWERMEDDEGRQYFVDHERQTTQRGFPAAQARAYRESVYGGEGLAR